MSIESLIKRIKETREPLAVTKSGCLTPEDLQTLVNKLPYSVRKLSGFNGIIFEGDAKNIFDLLFDQPLEPTNTIFADHRNAEEGEISGTPREDLKGLSPENAKFLVFDTRFEKGRLAKEFAKGNASEITIVALVQLGEINSKDLPANVKIISLIKVPANSKVKFLIDEFPTPRLLRGLSINPTLIYNLKNGYPETHPQGKTFRGIEITVPAQAPKHATPPLLDLDADLR